jgi:hypothetical protein
MLTPEANMGGFPGNVNGAPHCGSRKPPGGLGDPQFPLANEKCCETTTHVLPGVS